MQNRSCEPYFIDQAWHKNVIPFMQSSELVIVNKVFEMKIVIMFYIGNYQIEIESIKHNGKHNSERDVLFC